MDNVTAHLDLPPLEMTQVTGRARELLEQAREEPAG